jgi:hypothetical protein
MASRASSGVAVLLIFVMRYLEGHGRLGEGTAVQYRLRSECDGCVQLFRPEWSLQQCHII